MKSRPPELLINELATTLLGWRPRLRVLLWHKAKASILPKLLAQDGVLEGFTALLYRVGQCCTAKRSCPPACWWRCLAPRRLTQGSMEPPVNAASRADGCAEEWRWTTDPMVSAYCS